MKSNRHQASLITIMVMGVITASVAIAGTLPQVGSDNQIPNGDFADPILGPDSKWSIETNGVGASAVNRFDNHGSDRPDRLGLALHRGRRRRGASGFRLHPAERPGPGFPVPADGSLPGRHRVGDGQLDFHQPIRRSELHPVHRRLEPFGQHRPRHRNWSLIRTGISASSIRITLTQTSNGPATQGRWDDLRLRVPNFPETVNTTLFTQNSFGDVNEDDDRFGSVVAVGDFNGDGIDDAAFGIPDKDIAGIGSTDRGNVIVAFGSSTGLTGSGAQSITPALATQAGQRAGSALAAGDFNCDGFDDLAVGIPDYEAVAIPPRTDSGLVVVFNGSALGLMPSSETAISRFTGDIAGAPQPDDRFGAALTAGNFNRNEREC